MITILRRIKILLEDVPVKDNILNIIFTLIWVLLEGYLITKMSEMIANATKNGYFGKAVIFFFVYILIWEILEYVADYIMMMSTVHIENNAYRNAFNKLYVTKPEVLKNTNTGYIAGLVSKLVQYKKTAYIQFMTSMFIGIGYTLYVVVYMLKFSWIFSALILVISILGIIARLIGNKVSRKRIIRVRETSANRTKIFMDNITNISTVQKLRSKTFSDNKMQEINRECFNSVKHWKMLDEIFFCTYKYLMYSLAPVCIFAMLHIKDLNIDKIEFLSFLSIIEIQMVHTAKGIATFIREFNLYLQQQNKIDEIVKHRDGKYTNTSIGNNFIKIEINDVDYTYTRKDNKKSITVSIPHFEFNKGDFVCISGESGQGKTTTLNILSGAIDTNCVKIDGEYNDKNIDAVYIAQDIEMFDMSLRDNLTLGTNVSDDILLNFIKEVGLFEWFSQQPDGFDTILGERGVFISTGQRQRLNLIRGLLIKDKEIYLLDEPTSNVDTITEMKMINLIQKELKGKTVIIVTHREKIKEICNKQYRFKNGVCYTVKNELYDQ